MAATNTTRRAIFLDYQSTTPVDESVLNAMLPFFSDQFGNAHSTHHQFGWDAADAIEVARSQVAKAICADPADIVFTSGATESNNLALSGMVHQRDVQPVHIVSVATEHKATLATLDYLKSLGHSVTLLDVEATGLVTADQVKKALTPATRLVSVMAVNNEIGVIQPIKPIAALCNKAGIVFHTDTAQALGKIPLSVKRDGIGMASLSAHKIYGPKGVGALYCRRDVQDTVLPLIHGGGQEQGLRSGPLPVPLVVGMGRAAELAVERRVAEAKRLTVLRDAFLARLQADVHDFVIHGDLKKRVPGNLNIGFPGIDAEALLGLLPNLAVSLGSACTDAAPQPSHVLRALGVDYEVAAASIRVGFGRPTTDDDVHDAAAQLADAVNRLRGVN